MRRLIAVIALCGCSLGMRTVAPGWDGKTDPNCTDSQTAPLFDGITGGILLGVGLVGAEASLSANDRGEPSAAADAVALGGLASGLALGVGALIGTARYRECHDAYAQWRLGSAIRAR